MKLTAKRAISLLMAVLMIFTVFSVVSLAAEKNFGGSYGYIIPTDSNLKAQKTSYTFYGNSAKLYFMMFSMGKASAWYQVEVYSSKNYSEESLVASSTGEFTSKKGSVPLTINWKFKSNPSGTYYGRCYTYVAGKSEDTIDTGSVSKFTIKVNRIGKQTVSISSVKNSNGGVTVTWVPLTAATKYNVYRKAEGEKSWTRIVTLGKGASSYKDTTVKSGKKYTYTVKAADALYSSLYNKKGLSILYLATPKLSSVGATGSAGYAKFSWSKTGGAKGYYIYRKGGTLSNSSWERIATVNSKTLSYVDKKATSTDWRYTYTVRAYNGKTASSYNSSGVDFNYMKAPTLKSTAIAVTGIKTTWSYSNPLALKYYIYRKAAGETKWTKIGTSTSKSYTDTKVASGKTYTYTVRGIASTNGSAYNSAGIKSMFLSTPVLKPVTVDAKGVSTIKWSAVSGAAGYRVYRKAVGGSWEKIATIKSGKTVSYTDKAAKVSGQEYAYTVKSTNGAYYSGYNTAGELTMFLNKPSFKLSNAFGAEGNEGVNVTWSKVEAAESYTILKKADGETDWTVLAEGVTALSYFDSAVENGKSYTYAVKCTKGKYESSFDSSAITFINAPELTDAVITAEGTKLTWSAVTGADSYYIYRKAPNGEWSQIGSYSLCEFTDTSAEALTTPFVYTVLAGIGVNKSAFNSDGMKNYIDVTSVTASFTELPVPTNTVTWTENADSEKYELYRTAGDGEAQLLATVNAGEACEYIDTDVLPNVSYVYTVRSFKAEKLSGDVSSEKIEWRPAIAPVDFAITRIDPVDGNTASAKITFNAVEFADSYEIYKKTAESEWAVVKTIAAGEELSFTDTDIILDTTYYYSVKAVADDRDTLFDDAGKAVTVKTPLSPVSGISAVLVNDDKTPDTKNAVITWESVEGAVSYKVMRKTAETEWEVIDTLLLPGTLSFTDTNISQGTEYTYTVFAYSFDGASLNNETGVNIKWEWPSIPAVDFTIEKINPVGENAASVKLSFNPADFADSYEIYKKTAEGEWAVVKTIAAGEELSFTDADIVLDTEYFYSVKAVASDRETLFDDTGKAVTVKTPLSPVSGITVALADSTETADKKNAVITWESVEGAESYKVMRKTAETEWEVVNTVVLPGELSFTDTGILQGTEYTYTVFAYSSDCESYNNETGANIIWEA